MKAFIKCLPMLLLFALTFLSALQAQAQTLAKNGVWLEKQLNQLVTDDEKHNMTLKGKKATPKFSFQGCQMNMDLASKEEDVTIGMNLGWQLKDVRKVSYKKGKDGQYTLLLDVPADKVKMAMSMGGFSGSFNTDGKDKQNKDNSTSFTLDTKDEALVAGIKQKLEESVQLCRQGKN